MTSVERYLQEHAIGNYLDFELGSPEFREIYCARCNNNHWKSDKFGRRRFCCILAEGRNEKGTCESFYPKRDLKEHIEKYLLPKYEKAHTPAKTGVTEGNETKMRKGTVQEPVEAAEIPEGMHKGKITRMEERKSPFEYDDYFFTVDEMKKQNGEPFELKLGIPVSSDWSNGPPANTKYGRFLASFGIEEGKAFDIDKQIIGKEVEYYTRNEKGKDRDGNERTYARIVEDTVKPLK